MLRSGSSRPGVMMNRSCLLLRLSDLSVTGIAAKISRSKGRKQRADFLLHHGRVLQRAREKGSYALSAARGTAEFCPTLFQGCAGVGYMLLRLARPQDLPCLLLFE